MTRNGTSGQTDPMKLIFNYDNVFFSFFYDDAEGCVHRSHEFALNYVHSGEMVVDNGKESIRAGKGECIFIPRDHRLTIYKRSAGEELYCGIYMMFTRQFLRDMYAKTDWNGIPASTPKVDPGVIKLPQTPELESLFASMAPYLNPEVKPKEYFMKLKLQEGLLALLNLDERFAPTLFDFNEAWKIDILDFMNSNYMYDFSMEELAHYTGRSLATFKRDFKKISEVSPEKWLIRKRLDEAYSKIKDEGKRVVDVYSEVGFKNPSHFSTAFKKQFGVPPTAVYAEFCRQMTLDF